MDLITALFLGIIQGLTEFLPVSSSGHLEIAKAIFITDYTPKESMLMTVVLHFATALSTIVIFRKDIAKIVVGSFSRSNSADRKYSLNIVISMVPAVLVGILFDNLIEELFNKKILLVGGMLLITALLLYFADRSKPTQMKVSVKNSFIIGIAQAIAILPGISRSGATIATSVLLGVDKESAARFSFLMVIPLIFGKMAKDIIDGAIIIDDFNILNLIIGFFSAFITGLFACNLMIKLVKNSKLKYFSIYCFAVATLTVIFTYG